MWLLLQILWSLTEGGSHLSQSFDHIFSSMVFFSSLKGRAGSETVNVVSLFVKPFMWFWVFKQTWPDCLGCAAYSELLHCRVSSTEQKMTLTEIYQTRFHNLAGKWMWKKCGPHSFIFLYIVCLISFAIFCMYTQYHNKMFMNMNN